MSTSSPHAAVAGGGRGSAGIANGGNGTLNKSNVRGNLHESFPCIIGTDAQRIQLQVDEAVKRLVDEQCPSSTSTTTWAPHPKYRGVSQSSTGLFRVTATLPDANFTLSEAFSTFAYFHIHTHGPQILQSLLLAHLEQAKILALLPLSNTGASSGSGSSTTTTLSLSRGSSTSTSSSHSTTGNTSGNPHNASNIGGGPDSSVVKMVWSEKKQPAKEFILAQRTGRYHHTSSSTTSTSGAPVGDFVYYLATSFKNPQHIPLLGLTPPASSSTSATTTIKPTSPSDALGLSELPLLAFVVGPSVTQGAVDLTVLLSPTTFSPQTERKNLSPCLHFARTSLSRYLLETLAAHRSLHLTLPDLTLALISPFALQHRILLRMPDTTPLPPVPTYRLVTIRFLPSSSGTFSIKGLGPKDQALFPSRYFDHILHSSFQPGEQREVRFLISSSETKELTLWWTGLKKGKLHRYSVDVRIMPRAALTRTINLMQCLTYLPRTSRAGGRTRTGGRKGLEEGFSITRPAASVSVIQYPQQLKEALLPLACILPASFSSAATQDALSSTRTSTSTSSSSSSWGRKRSISSSSSSSSASSISSFSSSTTTSSFTRPPLSNSLSALLLPHLIPPPSLLLRFLDPLLPLLMSSSVYLFLYHALLHYPEAVVALEDLSLWALALGLGLIHLSLSLALHALSTSKLKVYLALVNLECVVLDERWWGRLVVGAHMLAAVVVTVVEGLASRVLTMEGGREGGRCTSEKGGGMWGWGGGQGGRREMMCGSSNHEWMVKYLDMLQLEGTSEDKLFVMGGMAVVAVVMAVMAAVPHFVCGSNRGLNIQIVSLLDKARVVAPLQAPSANARCLLSGPSGGAGREGGREGGGGGKEGGREGGREGGGKHDRREGGAGPRRGQSGSKDDPLASSDSAISEATRVQQQQQRRQKMTCATPRSAPVESSWGKWNSTKSGSSSANPRRGGRGEGGGREGVSPSPFSLSGKVGLGALLGVSSGSAVAGAGGLSKENGLNTQTPPSKGSNVHEHEHEDEDDVEEQSESAVAAPAPIAAAAGGAAAGGAAAGGAEAEAGGGGEGEGGGGYGRVIEPDYEREMGRPTVDKAMRKSGIVQEERYTGVGLSRHKMWKDVFLVVDEEAITVLKRKDDTSLIHHRFPVSKVGTRRVVYPPSALGGGREAYAGFVLYYDNVSLELRCDGGEGEVDKWLSVLQWNAVVAARKAQQGVGSTGGGGGGGWKKG